VNLQKLISLSSSTRVIRGSSLIGFMGVGA
jgi:hypothetical protein